MYGKTKFCFVSVQIFLSVQIISFSSDYFLSTMYGNRHFEQPENVICEDAEMELCRLTVIDTEAKFIRGELLPNQMVDVARIMGPVYMKRLTEKKQFKEASLVNQKVRIKKIAKRVTNLLQASVNKSRGTKHFRPGKQTSTLKAIDKKLKKAERDYCKLGFGGSHWEDFVNDICRSRGMKPMY